MKRLASRTAWTNVVSSATMIAMVCALSAGPAVASPLGGDAVKAGQQENGITQDRTAPHDGRRHGRVAPSGNGIPVGEKPLVSTSKTYTRKPYAGVAGSNTNPYSKSRTRSRSNGGGAFLVIVVIAVVLTLIVVAAASEKSKEGGGGGFFFFGGCGGGGCGGGGCGGGGCGGGCGGCGGCGG